MCTDTLILRANSAGTVCLALVRGDGEMDVRQVLVREPRYLAGGGVRVMLP